MNPNVPMNLIQKSKGLVTKKNCKTQEYYIS